MKSLLLNEIIILKFQLLLDYNDFLGCTVFCVVMLDSPSNLYLICKASEVVLEYSTMQMFTFHF